MKLHFDNNEPHQLEAVSSIVDILEGQAQRNSMFTIIGGQKLYGAEMTATGIANSQLTISEHQILENIKKIQRRNMLRVSDDERLQYRDFTIEMETGTGKTYVYTRTIMELNKKYGFSKFIVVVPSIAIREGVNKSLEITKEHFEGIYPGQKYNYFKYDSNKLERLRNFATSQQIEIMIINIDAFRKSFDDPEKESKANLIHRDRDGIGKPINFIQETRPIVIIDEPQSVDNTPKAKEAIKSLNPLLTLRYSATHREKYYLVYRLDPVDAYQRNLVKKIEVKSIVAGGDFNVPYIRLVSTEKKDDTFFAKIELDVMDKSRIKRKSIKAKITNRSPQINLYEFSGERQAYQKFIINKISCDPANRYVEFTTGERLAVGEAIGEGSNLDIKRVQIHSTIEQHLDKELTYLSKGIKVLSLFFIDRVANYRTYNEDGTVGKGPLAQIFEEEYQKLIKLPRYATILNNPYLKQSEIDKLHDGYFAQDKQGHWKDVNEDSEGNLRGNAQELEDTFDLIMRDKERLLSFDTQLRFIFSHSALKEGWDNPNVFQICTLVETRDTMTKRQKIGRGLRLAVDQKGQRIRVPDLNILTVVANESYNDFADTLQKEIESETGLRFGVVDDNSFYEIAPAGADPVIWSKELMAELRQTGYLDQKGKITDKLIADVKNGKLEVSVRFQGQTQNPEFPTRLERIKKLQK
jgi:type III restriction enzyme